MSLRGNALAMFGFTSIVAVPVIAQDASGDILARSTACVLTTRDLQDIFDMDGSVLETPLSPAEREDGRKRILGQFYANPAAFCASLPSTRKYAEIMHHGSASERRQIGVDLWNGWLAGATYDPLQADWVAVVKRHNPPIVSADGLVISKRQIDAMFASNDWVAQAANLPTSTPESRAAFTKGLSAKFASTPQAQKEQLAAADLRWLALKYQILGFSDLRAKAGGYVHQQVHGPGDVAAEARSLEDSALKFQALREKNGQGWKQIIAAQAGALNVQNLSNAKWPDLSVPTPHNPPPHTRH
jgi:hypothetical protein